MSDDLVKQAIAELQDVVRCRCHPAYTGRGLHDPDCECDSADAVKVISDRIEELEAKALANKVAIMRLECESARMREALTPSGDTKAAYISEIECDCLTETWRHNVPWTSIKKIMKMIRARAKQRQAAILRSYEVPANEARMDALWDVAQNDPDPNGDVTVGKRKFRTDGGLER